MPFYSWQLNDDQVAAVLTYTRNSWGATAAAVSADEVAFWRTELADRTD